MKKAGSFINMERFKKKEKYMGKSKEDLKKEFGQTAAALGVKYYEQKCLDYEMGQLAEEMRQITIKSNELGDEDGQNSTKTE